MLKPSELDGLVAPIAVYPDTLLANVLMAATYPLEVVQAERWMNQNKKLKRDALKAAAEKQDWDASVKTLLAAPSVPRGIQLPPPANRAPPPAGLKCPAREAVRADGRPLPLSGGRENTCGHLRF